MVTPSDLVAILQPDSSDAKCGQFCPMGVRAYPQELFQSERHETASCQFAPVPNDVVPSVNQRPPRFRPALSAARPSPQLFLRFREGTVGRTKHGAR